MVKEFRTRKFGRLHWLLRLVALCGIISLQHPSLDKKVLSDAIARRLEKGETQRAVQKALVSSLCEVDDGNHASLLWRISDKNNLSPESESIRFAATLSLGFLADPSSHQILDAMNELDRPIGVATEWDIRRIDARQHANPEIGP